MLFNSRSYSNLDPFPSELILIQILFHDFATACQNFSSYSIISYSLDLIQPSSLSEQYRLYKIIILDVQT